MNMVDIILTAILIGCVAGAVLHIYKKKKSGASCMGCPNAGNCSKNCKGCGGGSAKP